MDPIYNRNKLILITVFITAVVTSLAWVGMGSVAYFAMYRDAPPFQIEVDHPEAVDLGDVLRVIVKVENIGKTEMKLAEIDLYDELLDGFEVVSLVPSPRSRERIMGFATYGFNQVLKPGDVFTLEVALRAKEVGLWGGDIDACTPTQNLVTHYTEIEVIDPAAP